LQKVLGGYYFYSHCIHTLAKLLPRFART